MTSELNILKLVCQRLELAQLSYMITGSFAANFYAVPRMTRDLDIVIEITQQDPNRLMKIFQTDFYIDEHTIIHAIKHQGMFNIIHNKSIFKIDFIIRKDSDYRKTEFERKQLMQIDDTHVWVVTPEDLIISKLLWAKDSFSDMQLRDVRNIFASLENLDYTYINDWIKKLELYEIYKKITN